MRCLFARGCQSSVASRQQMVVALIFRAPHEIWRGLMRLSKTMIFATRWFLPCLALALFCGIACAQDLGAKANLPTLFLVGDSTVRNGAGDGANKQWGWGEPIATYFDPAKITVLNRARGGRSSRTFLTEGLWDQVLSAMKPGDFVLIQFGQKDGGPNNDAPLLTRPM